MSPHCFQDTVHCAPPSLSGLSFVGAFGRQRFLWMNSSSLLKECTGEGSAIARMSLAAEIVPVMLRHSRANVWTLSIAMVEPPWVKNLGWARPIVKPLASGSSLFQSPESLRTFQRPTRKLSVGHVLILRIPVWTRF